jgi:pimeloyl-ACP methyl ester carboxylesterase
VAMQVPRTLGGRFAARRDRSFRITGFLACIALLTVGCATPVGVARVDPRTVHRTLTRNVLTKGELSAPTRIILERADLYEEFRRSPDAALAELHARARVDGGGDVLFALAEASFLRAERTGKRFHFRAAAIYAYAFLFPDDPTQLPDPYDPRFRLACDLYNRGLTAGFASDDGSEVMLQSALYELPFGWIEVDFDRASLAWGTRRLERFTPAAELAIRGLRNRYRRAGIGAPLTASGAVPEGVVADDFVPRGVKVPVNAFLRIERPREQLASARMRATLELRIGFDANQIAVGERRVPMELESSSFLAYMLAESNVWERELKGFLLGDLTREETRLVGLYPYRPGRIPVVLVHGTASSAGRWADLLNDLLNDPRIFRRYQFWFFGYDTGNPVAYSASLLRQSLADAIERFDPKGEDPALREMVLVGHSQGGLLVRMMAIETGDRLWSQLSKVPLDQLDVEAETRELLRNVLFVEPVPAVARVVFVATPHRGSFIAGNPIAHWVANFGRLPGRLARAGVDVLTRNPGALRIPSITRLPTSVDNMTPSHPFIRALASISIASDIRTHSIIAVAGDGPVETGHDGVVAYESAHLEGVESELVVRSHHSVQGHPDAIEEVRRILLLHAGGE